MLVWTSKISPGRATETTCVMSGSLLDRGLDQDQPAVGAGDGALDEDQALLGVHGLDGHARRAHAAGHAHALEDATGGRAGADGTGRTVLALHAVARAEAPEVVALHDTGEAVALGGAGDVDDLTLREGLGGHLLAEGVLGGVGGADLHGVAARRHAGLREV